MEQIGEYRIKHLLGEGGMGRVYAAEERLSKRPVALKVLREELAHSPAARRRFITELEILARLEHPNIVRSLASIEADGQLVAVLEYLQGSTLRQLLDRRGALRWQEAVSVVVEVARALQAAHGQQPPVVHRDLKPDNIMLLDDGGVKVTDFGIAKLLDDLGQTHTSGVGTLQYMSPEQLDGGQVDHRGDLYGLGVVLYELIAGALPFRATSVRALIHEQLSERPEPLEAELLRQLPRGVHALLLQLLEKDPEARPASASAVLAQLDPFVPVAPAAKLILADSPCHTSAAARPASDTVADGPLQPTAPSQAAPAPTKLSEPAVVVAPPDPSAGVAAAAGGGALASWHATGARAAWLGRFALGPFTRSSQDGGAAGSAPGLTEPAAAQSQPPAAPTRAPQWLLPLQIWLERDLSSRSALALVALMTVAAAVLTFVWRSAGG